MKRRKALLGISLITGGALFSYAGFKWYKLNAVPDFDFLSKNSKLLACLADCIIPKSDSPSASECHVQDFIIKMVMGSTDARTQNNFISGLIDLEETSSTWYGKSFVVCSPAEKNEIVTRFSAKDKQQTGILGKIQKRLVGNTFFTTLKEYTVIGYFTSQQGATNALRYSLIPGKYSGCQPYQSGEKAWATY